MGPVVPATAALLPLMVGLAVVEYTNPRWVIGSPPSALTLPATSAPVGVRLTAGVVVLTVGG